MQADLDRLKQAARDRWGDSWTISITLWADGSTQSYATRSRGEVRRDEPEQYVERERLWPKEEGFAYDRVVVRDEEVVEVIEQHEPGE